MEFADKIGIVGEEKTVDEVGRKKCISYVEKSNYSGANCELGYLVVFLKLSKHVQYLVGLGDILINRDISNRDYRIEAKNLSDDLSKLSSCSMTIVILLGNMYITCRILKKAESIFAFQQQIYSQKVY